MDNKSYELLETQRKVGKNVIEAAIEIAGNKS